MHHIRVEITLQRRLGFEGSSRFVAFFASCNAIFDSREALENLVAACLAPRLGD